MLVFNEISQIHLCKLEDLKKNPVEGFAVNLVDDDIYKWEIYILGPSDTFYEGGAFRTILTFPHDYPYTPPKLKFTSEVWHPNVYNTGKDAGEVCISILHPPGGNPEMPDECESDAERWSPLHSVTTIILSVISLFSDPNFSSPANIDASVQWRRDPEGFRARVKEGVQRSIRELPRDFEWPVVKKPVILVDSYMEDIPPEEEEEDTEKEDPMISGFLGMGFARSEIEKVINQLKKAGKQVNQENIADRLC